MTDQQTRGSGPDLIGDFQRWLLRSSARGVSREVGDQIRAVFGRSAGPADVWQTATAEPPPGEAPECAWCPVCRAARLLRESGPGLASQVAAAGDALGSLLQDAVGVAEAALANASRPAGADRPGQPEEEPAGVTVAQASLKGSGPARAAGAEGREQASQSREGLPSEPDDRD